jgi:hypothetical protein
VYGVEAVGTVGAPIEGKGPAMLPSKLESANGGKDLVLITSAIITNVADAVGPSTTIEEELQCQNL